MGHLQKQGGHGDRGWRPARLRAGDRAAARGRRGRPGDHGHRAGRDSRRTHETHDRLASGSRPSPTRFGDRRPGRTALVDVRAANQIQRAVDLADRTFGRIDILVNNAAAPPGADRVPVVELPEEPWHVILETNLTGTYLCSKAVARLMLARSIPGRIINMSSNCGKVGYARLAAYCASKFGVIGFTQALAMELAPHGITVNAIAPAPRHRSARLPRAAARRELRRRTSREGHRRAVGPIPLQRVATAEDMAELTAFLGSDAAGYVTGQAIDLGGRRHHALTAGPARGASPVKAEEGGPPCRPRCSRCPRGRPGPRSER